MSGRRGSGVRPQRPKTAKNNRASGARLSKPTLASYSGSLMPRDNSGPRSGKRKGSARPTQQ